MNRFILLTHTDYLGYKNNTRQCWQAIKNTPSLTDAPNKTTKKYTAKTNTDTNNKQSV